MPKIDNLRIFCATYHPDLICVTESWLGSEISIQGYSVIRLDRNRHGGGVLIYVKSVFSCSLVFKGTADLELIVASFVCTIPGTSPDFTLGLFYRPPHSSSFVLDSLFTVLCNLNVSIFAIFYLIGDFNIDYFCTSHPLYCKLTSVVSSFNLTQIVTEPTRTTNSSATLIDLIFASSPTQVESCSTIPPLQTLITMVFA